MLSHSPSLSPLPRRRSQSTISGEIRASPSGHIASMADKSHGQHYNTEHSQSPSLVSSPRFLRKEVGRSCL
ncbi:hypothetical protein L1049_005008 [Liquidambar formosana]|uniref:Uncharacterized protein n=1 Tax=Liquidambar formosana TaxID=63359 RepID=A0AAP0RPF2_LIQFO